MKFILTIAVILILPALYGQKINKDYRINIHRTELPIKVDGKTDDPAWTTAELADNFFMVLPMDTSKSIARTTVQFCYDDKNLYLVAVCYKAQAGENMVESLRRDFNFGKNSCSGSRKNNGVCFNGLAE